MADIRHQPGGSEKMNATKQNELPSRATRLAIYEKTSTLGVYNNQRFR